MNLYPGLEEQHQSLGISKKRFAEIEAFAYQQVVLEIKDGKGKDIDFACLIVVMNQYCKTQSEFGFAMWFLAIGFEAARNDREFLVEIRKTEPMARRKAA